MIGKELELACYTDSSVESCTKCQSKSCVVLAARKGDFEVFQNVISRNSIPSSNHSNTTQSFDADIATNDTEKRGLCELKANLSRPCDFESCTDSNETILHLILKRPLLQRLISDQKADSELENVKTKALELDKGYQKCIEILLNTEYTRRGASVYHTPISTIINIKDKPHGNTPLHYAVHSWSDDVVRRILSFGGNLSVENKEGEKPLSRIKKKTLKSFLDKSCMLPSKIDSQVGFPSMYARSSKSVHEENEILSGYTINRFIGKKSVEPMGHTTPIDFKFDFLAPAITKPTLQGSTDKVSSSCMSHEMDVLQSICHSKEHQALVTHPCLLYTSPSPRDGLLSRMPSSA